MNELSIKAKGRLSNIELLRIISMIMVVTLHFLGRGLEQDNLPVFSPAYFVTSIWDAVAIISVDLFVLISGYFLINSQFKCQKLINIIIQVFTYSLGLYIICVATGIVSFSISGFIKAFLPLLTNQYWFATAYVALYIIFPFLNKCIHALTKTQHRNLCIILGAAMTLYLPSKALGANGTSVAWFICLYVFAAYLRLYYTPQKKDIKIASAIWIISTATLPLSKFVVAFLSTVTSDVILKYSKWFYKYNSVFVLIAAISLFVCFLNINIKNEKSNKIIAYVSPLTFGVYLLHNNPSIRDFMWGKINLQILLDNIGIGLFFITGILIILLIFCICACIESIRLWIYRKIIYSSIYKNIYEKVANFKIFNLFK